MPGETDRIGVEGQAPSDGLGPDRRLPGRRHVNGHAEAVQELGPEVPFFGVHRPDEDKTAGVDVGHAVTFDPVDAARGHVEQDVHQMVGQQVDLVDVQHAAMGGSQETGLKAVLAAGQRRRQVEGADQAVLGRADGQLDEGGRPGQKGGQGPGERGLGTALVPSQQHPGEGGVDGSQ